MPPNGPPVAIIAAVGIGVGLLMLTIAALHIIGGIRNLEVSWTQFDDHSLGTRPTRFIHLLLWPNKCGPGNLGIDCVPKSGHRKRI